MEASKYWCSRINMANDFRRNQASSVLNGSDKILMESMYDDDFLIVDEDVTKIQEFKKNENVNLVNFRSAMFDVLRSKFGVFKKSIKEEC